MADATTSNFGFTKPEVGASEDSWGAKLNNNWDSIDALMAKAIQHTGQCRLILDAGVLKLVRVNGRYLWCNGELCTVPATPVSLAATGLSVGTIYFIYAVQTSGVITSLEASTTARATHTDGTQIKSGDSSRALVGMARVGTGPAWYDQAGIRYLRSWHNDLGIRVFTVFGGTVGTSSSSLVELYSAARAHFIYWANEVMLFSLGGTVTIPAGGQLASAAIYLNGSTDIVAGYYARYQGDGDDASGGYAKPLSRSGSYQLGSSDAYAYATVMGTVSGGGTANFNMIQDMVLRGVK